MKKQLMRWAAAVSVVLVLTVEAAAAPRMLIPGGSTIGIKLDTQGVIVTGFAENSSAQRAGIEKGDVIVEVDGAEVHTAAALQENLDRASVVLTVLRNGEGSTVLRHAQPDRRGGEIGRLCAGFHCRNRNGDVL